MPSRTTHQHFVPRTYLKAWERAIQGQGQSTNISRGVYYYRDTAQTCEVRSIESILWKPNLYTINFDQLFIGEGCPAVYNDFAKQVWDLMCKFKPEPVFGKHNHSIIKKQRSVYKHLNNIEDWEFYYYDGRLARKKSILNEIYRLKSYILEDGFNTKFETSWSSTLEALSTEIHDSARTRIEDGRKYIDLEASTAYSIFSFFHMMECRNPRFSGMGILGWLDQEIRSIFTGETDQFMQGIWYTEIYRMLFKNSSGMFQARLKASMEHCQMICFEVSHDAGTFITSDNPAFLYNTLAPEAQNRTGFYFPLSPSLLLFMGRGDGMFNSIQYRVANENAVKTINDIIYRNRSKAIVSMEPSYDNIF